VRRPSDREATRSVRAWVLMVTRPSVSGAAFGVADGFGARASAHQRDRARVARAKPLTFAGLHHRAPGLTPDPIQLNAHHRDRSLGVRDRGRGSACPTPLPGPRPLPSPNPFPRGPRAPPFMESRVLVADRSLGAREHGFGSALPEGPPGTPRPLPLPSPSQGAARALFHGNQECSLRGLIAVPSAQRLNPAVRDRGLLLGEFVQRDHCGARLFSAEAASWGFSDPGKPCATPKAGPIRACLVTIKDLLDHSAHGAFVRSPGDGL